MRLRHWFLTGVIIGVIASYYYVVRVKANLIYLEPAGIPVAISIPALQVKAAVEQVGQDADGRMSVPKKVHDTGWYALGTRPGDTGNAVVDGHVNTPQLTPSVFARLSTLKSGDLIQVEDSGKKMRTFRVYSVKNIPSDNFPVGTVFGSSGQRDLVLITCSGYYQKSQKDYTFRTVVFSRLLN